MSSGQITNQLLTAQEEVQLVQWLTEMTDRNIPARVNMINSMAGTILNARQDGSTIQVGTRWYRAFLRRHPDITTKLSQNLDRVRLTAFTSSLLGDWFNLFRSTLERYNITLDRVYNMDKTGIAMGLIGRSMVVVPRAAAD